jgi:DNA (cytosine-5)-methyltransferase 1
MPTGEVITPDIRDAERFQGFPENWTKPAEQVGRASLRWSLVGNAVSVPVARWLGRRLATPASYETERDGGLPSDGRWPKAARFDGRRRYAVSINAYPQWKARPTLTEFLRHDGKPLSARATRGFLSRTERAALRFADGFQDRLRGHLYRMEAHERASDTRLAIAAE